MGHMPTATNPKTLTLRQFMVLAGFDRIADLVRRAAEIGKPVPQPAVSAMLGGGQSYPKARDSVRSVLDVTEKRLQELIANSAEEARRRASSDK